MSQVELVEDKTTNFAADCLNSKLNQRRPTEREDTEQKKEREKNNNNNWAMGDVDPKSIKTEHGIKHVSSGP